MCIIDLASCYAVMAADKSHVSGRTLENYHPSSALDPVLSNCQFNQIENEVRVTVREECAPPLKVTGSIFDTFFLQWWGLATHGEKDLHASDVDTLRYDASMRVPPMIHAFDAKKVKLRASLPPPRGRMVLTRQMIIAVICSSSLRNTLHHQNHPQFLLV